MNQDIRQWAGPVASPSPEDLADRYAASQLVKIYALGIDMRDYELCRSAFAPDARAEGSVGPIASIDDYLPKVFGGAQAFKATQHNIMNQYVTVNGDEALVWSYAVAFHKPETGTDLQEITVGVQYRDTCRRFPDGWLIVERRAVTQWVERGPPKS